MQEPKEVTVSMTQKFFTIDLPIDDEKLIASVFLGLTHYVKKGFPIKITQSYESFSGSQQITTRIIKRTQQVAEWGKETKALISTLRKYK